MAVTVRGDAREIIAYAWYGLGFRPRESLVAVSLHGPRLRAGLVLRVDLGGDLVTTVGGLVQALQRDRARAVVALVVTDGGRLLAASAALEVARALPSHGLRVVDVLHVGPRTWCSLGPGVESPPLTEGGERLLEELDASETAAHMVTRGRVLVGDETDLVADVEVCRVAFPADGVPAPGVPADGVPASGVPAPGVPADGVPASGLPASGVPAAGVPGGGRADVTDPVTGTRSVRSPGDWFRIWRSALEPSAEPSRLPVGLAWALRDVRLRDAVLLSLVPGTGRLPEEILAGGSPDLSASLARVPDVDLLERGRELLAGLTRSAAPEHRAEVIAVLAWMAWWSGEGVRARLLVDRAGASRLATLVGELLLAQVAPLWVDRSARTA
jgi:hypothetical protein